MSKELAKTYDPKQIEEKLYERWCENKYFHAEVDRSKKPFTTVMPPPNITGNLHIKMLDLRRPIYKQTAAYGHFGRNDLDLPWEKLDKVDALKKYL